MPSAAERASGCPLLASARPPPCRGRGSKQRNAANDDRRKGGTGVEGREPR